MDLKLTRYSSAVFLFMLSGLSLLIPRLLSMFSGQPVDGAWVFASIAVLVWLVLAIPEAKGYVLTKDGIEICFLGIRYRTVNWSDICDAVTGPDPLEKYTGRTTILLDLRHDTKIRIALQGIPPFYSREVYIALLQGQIIRLRCGKHLGEVLNMTSEQHPNTIRVV